MDIDIPERIEVFEKLNGLLKDLAIEEESTWIVSQLAKDPVFSSPPGFVDSIRADDIQRFLSMYHMEKLEIPFIAMYRKEQCRSLILDPDWFSVETNLRVFYSNKGCRVHRHKVLWAVHELHQEWLLLQKQKESSFNSHAVDTDRTTEIKKLTHQFGCSFKEFKFPFPDEICQWEDVNETPEEMASKVNVLELARLDILTEARNMVALEISFEPAVKEHVRSKYLNLLQLSTSPVNHKNENCKLRILQRKPLDTVDEVGWLHIQKQEESNLLQVTFNLPDEQQTMLTNVLNEYSLRAVSKSVPEWEKQRNLIFDIAVSTHLLPFLEKEARTLLSTRAKKRLKREYGNSLWKKVSVGPWSPRASPVPKKVIEDRRYVPWSERNPTLKPFYPKVMACSWTESQAPVFVVLDIHGKVIEVLLTPVYIDYSADTDASREMIAREDVFKQKFLADLLKFMKEHKPDVTILEAHYLSPNLKENISWIKSGPGPLNVVYADESLSNLNAEDWGISMSATFTDPEYAGFNNPKYAGISSTRPQEPKLRKNDRREARDALRRAVVLGRYLQNPLVTVATLCGSKRGVLSWDICPHQELLTPDEKYSVIEQVMLDVTNQVGIDINLAIKHKRLFAPLRFISGLGVRKAKVLQQSLESAGIIRKRDELKSHGLGEKVFLNAVGFFRVHFGGPPGDGCTRIHPESYYLAEEMEKFNTDLVWLRKFVVDGYARLKNRESRTLTLYDIRRELLLGFRDWRTCNRQQQPSAEEDARMKTVGRTSNLLTN